MVRANDGPVVMEVNSSPCLQDVKNATSIDVAEKIIEFLEANAVKGKTKTKGKG